MKKSVFTQPGSSADIRGVATNVRLADRDMRTGLC
jgi:hypothetical protein